MWFEISEIDFKVDDVHGHPGRRATRASPRQAGSDPILWRDFFWILHPGRLTCSHHHGNLVQIIFLSKWVICRFMLIFQGVYTPPNIEPDNHPIWKEHSLPIIHFQVPTVTYREGTLLGTHISFFSWDFWVDKIPGESTTPKVLFREQKSCSSW